MGMWYINKLISDDYYKYLLSVRDLVSKSCDEFFKKNEAKKVDLYLITNSASSPMGRGSDSKPLYINFGGRRTCLADSSQFGMEPLVLKHFDIVYCYLPSFRGEKPDNEHLNQFFHCEAEMRGDLKRAIRIASALVKHIAKNVMGSRDFATLGKQKTHIDRLINMDFPVIRFDKAFRILQNQPNAKKYIRITKYGRILTREGEIKLVKLITTNEVPLWVSHYDRDVVPFYQKPYPEDSNRVLNADLLFPSIDGAFGGEVIGAGQRQDNPEEIIESMSRQKVKNPGDYDWYIKLRKSRFYRSTSGFGLGIERLLAWMLCKESISEVIIFPRTFAASLKP